MSIKCGSRSAGKNESDFDEEQLKLGEKVEYEHTCDKTKARRIAMDHLAEFPDYYKELKKMEDKLDKKKGKSTKSTKQNAPPTQPKTYKKSGQIKSMKTKEITRDHIEDNMETIAKFGEAASKKIINNISNKFEYKR